MGTGVQNSKNQCIKESPGYIRKPRKGECHPSSNMVTSYPPRPDRVAKSILKVAKDSFDNVCQDVLLETLSRLQNE